MNDLLNFLWNNGVGQNLTAGAIVFVLGTVLWRMFLKPRVSQHLSKLHEIHAKVDEMHQVHTERSKVRETPLEPRL